MVNLRSIKYIKNLFKKEKLNFDDLSNIEVELEIPDGFIKTDYWGVDQYELYRKNSFKFPYILKSVKFNIVVDNPEFIGKTIPIG